MSCDVIWNFSKTSLHGLTSTHVVGEAGSENGHLMILGLDIKDPRTPPSYKGHEEVVKLLLNNGADSFGRGLRTTLGTDVLIRFRDHVTHGYLDRIAPPQTAIIYHLVSYLIIRLYALVNALAITISY
jgi:hypothetical protein